MRTKIRKTCISLRGIVDIVSTIPTSCWSPDIPSFTLDNYETMSESKCSHEKSMDLQHGSWWSRNIPSNNVHNTEGMDGGINGPTDHPTNSCQILVNNSVESFRLISKLVRAPPILCFLPVPSMMYCIKGRLSWLDPFGTLNVCTWAIRPASITCLTFQPKFEICV